MALRSDGYPWLNEAACRNEPTEVFFAEDPRSEERAKAVCRSCPSMVACLEYAVTAYPTERGVWGGTTSAERVQIRRRRGLNYSFGGRPSPVGAAR